MKKPTKAVLVLFVLVIKTSRKVKGDEISHVSQNMGEDGYIYEYSVVDGDSSWMQSHGEWSDGISTHGSYNVKLPDGRIQKVIYTADEHGFRPVISYENPFKGYGLRNHIHLGSVDEHSSKKELIGRKVVRYEENEFGSDGLYEPIPPPFYEMTKLHNVPAHRPKAYDMHKSSEMSKEDNMDHYPTKSSEKSKDAMDRYSTKSNEKSKDAMDRYSTKSSEKNKEDAMDRYSNKSIEKPYSSYVSHAHKRVRYPAYHKVNKYQQGHVMRYPKYNNRGKYPTEKAKTYYVNESGKEIYMEESSEEEDMNDSRYDFNVMDEGDYNMRNDKEEQNAAMEVTGNEKEPNEMANFTPMPNLSYQMKKMKGDSQAGKEDKENTAKEMKEKEESSEELVENDSEESEEDESEERSQYVAKMTSMMPPDKPYVPPTYFSFPSSESSSEESSVESSYPSPTTPMTPPLVRSPSDETPHPPPTDTGSSYEPSLQKRPPPSFYPSRNANAHTVNAIPSPIYPPFQSPFNYQPLRLPYHPHHLHPMAPYSLTPVTPLYHYSAHHPFTHHHYQSPPRYSHPYMMGDSMPSSPSALYDAPATDEVSEAQ